MNRIQCIRRLAAVLTGLVGALLASAPAALARVPPRAAAAASPLPRRPVSRSSRAACLAGRSPSSRPGAALLAAVLAVIADRARATRRRQMAGAA